AFPEVYIAGYGWMVFEPTVSADDSTEKFIAFFKGIGENFAASGNFFYKLFISLPIWIRTFFIPIFLIAAVLMIRVIIILRKSVWRRNVIKRQGHKSLESIFKKITVLLNKINVDMKVHETPSGYSARVLEETGIEISDLSEIFNKSKYGGIEPTTEDIKTAMDIHKKVEDIIKERVGIVRSILI
ncbi:MAG: transglutaminase domain-containing protein, partial [Bacillota bacterium]|nr:transglutaminase domain-containing protein [Bacillota bacterium]